jgi:hypothetical protein
MGAAEETSSALSKNATPLGQERGVAGRGWYVGPCLWIVYAISSSRIY